MLDNPANAVIFAIVLGAVIRLIIQYRNGKAAEKVEKAATSKHGPESP